MKKLTTAVSVKLFMLLLFLFLLGCKKDRLQQNKNNPAQQSLSIEEAKQYFNKYLKPNIKLMTVEDSSSAGIKTAAQFYAHKEVLWNKAYQQQISIGTSVKIPLDFVKNAWYINQAKKELVPLSALNYLFMYKDSLQQIHSEWVILMPDQAWLKGNRSQFTGRIVVKNWNNGQVIKTFDYGGNTNSGLKTSKLTIATSLDPPGGPTCITFQVWDRCTCYDKSDCDFYRNKNIYHT